MRVSEWCVYVYWGLLVGYGMRFRSWGGCGTSEHFPALPSPPIPADADFIAGKLLRLEAGSQKERQGWKSQGVEWQSLALPFVAWDGSAAGLTAGCPRCCFALCSYLEKFTSMLLSAADKLCMQGPCWMLSAFPHWYTRQDLRSTSLIKECKGILLTGSSEQVQLQMPLPTALAWPR